MTSEGSRIYYNDETKEYEYYYSKSIFMRTDGNSIEFTNSTFQDLTFKGDTSQVAIISNDIENSTKFDNCLFFNCLTLGDEYNREYGKGCAINLKSYNNTIINTDFINFNATYGGVMFLKPSLPDAQYNIVNCKFINSSAKYGGAIYCANDFDYNEIIYWGDNDEDDIIIQKNYTDIVNIINCIFENNTALYGGAIYLAGSEFRDSQGYIMKYAIINCTFENNTASHDGGAVYFTEYAGNVTIFNSKFNNNHAAHNGGAIYILANDYTLNLINESIFTNNHADYNGGAFYFNDTFNKELFVDYRWHNRTVMFSDNLKTFEGYNTQILNSKFENNTDYTLKIIAGGIQPSRNQTVTIYIAPDATGSVEVNITFEDGNFVTRNYTLENGSVTFDVGVLRLGDYSISVRYDNYSYEDTNEYLFHINASILNVCKLDLNVNVSANNCTVKDNVSFIITNLPNDFKGKVNITVDGKTYTREVNSTILIPNLNSGNKTANVTFWDDGDYNNLTISVNFTVKKLDLDPSVIVNNGTAHDDVVLNITDVPEDFNGNVSVVDSNGNVLYNGSVNSTINIGKLPAGDYAVNATFYGDENYTEITKDVNITVEKSLIDPTVIVNNGTAHDDVVLNITDVPVDFNGNVGVVDSNGNVLYNGSVNSTINIGKLPAGDYAVNVTFYGDENYTEITKDVNITVEKSLIDPTVIVNSTSVQEDVVLNITDVPEDFNGNVSVVDSNGNVLYNGSVNSTINIGKLPIGDNTVNTTFYGDKNYSEVTKSLTINIFSTINAEDMVRGWNSPYDYLAKFSDNEGNPLKNSDVIIMVNDKKYDVKTDENGLAKLSSSKLAVGEYNVTVVNNITGENASAKLSIVKRLIENNDLTLYYRDGSKWTVRAIGDDGKPVGEGQIVVITTHGISYKCKTDKNGYARLLIELLPKSYSIVAEYKNYKVTNKIKIKQTLKPVKKTIKVKKSVKSFKIKASLKQGKKPVKGQKIVFKIKGKKYSAKTNKKGIAIVKIKKNLIKTLKKGKKYVVKISYSKKYYYSGKIAHNRVKCYVKVK